MQIKIPTRRIKRRVFFCLTLFSSALTYLCLNTAVAEKATDAYVPKNQQKIILTLPDDLVLPITNNEASASNSASKKKVQLSSAELKIKKDQITKLIEIGRVNAESRNFGYSQAQLSPLLKQQPNDPELWLLQGHIHDYEHAFDAAKQAFQQAITNSNLTDKKLFFINATLALANIHVVEADFSQAKKICNYLVSPQTILNASTNAVTTDPRQNMRRSTAISNIAIVGCDAVIQARTGELTSAVANVESLLNSTLNSALSSTENLATTQDPQTRAWLLANLAEMYVQNYTNNKNDNESTIRQLYTKALTQQPNNLNVKLSYADWLLDNQLATETLTLLASAPDYIGVHIRQARALKQLNNNKNDFAALQQKIDTFFKRSAVRAFDNQATGNERELAYYHLHISGNYNEGLKAAKTNWLTQKEPLDAALLLELGYQTNDSDAVALVLDFIKTTKLQDNRLTAISMRHSQ